MPLRTWDRWVIGCVGVITAAWGALAIVAAFWNARGLVEGIAFIAMSHPIASSVVGALAVLAALHLITLSWPAEGRDIGLLDETGLGRVRVALRAVEGLALGAVRSVPGVVTGEVAVRAGADGLYVSVELLLDGQRALPETTAEVQAEVERVLSRVAGVAVGHIDVRVRGVDGRSTPPTK